MKRLDPGKRALISIAVFCFIGLFLFLFSPRLFFVLHSLGGIFMLLILALVMVVTFRRAKSLSPGHGAL
jgi:hypothetical protein